MLHYENLQLYVRLGLKLNTIHHIFELNQLQWLKPNAEFNTQKRIGAKNYDDKDGKALYK